MITANYDLLFAKYRVLDAMGELVNSIYKDSSLNYYKPVFANYENVTDGKVIDRTDLDKDGVNIIPQNVKTTFSKILFS